MPRRRLLSILALLVLAGAPAPPAAAHGGALHEHLGADPAAPGPARVHTRTLGRGSQAPRHRASSALPSLRVVRAVGGYEVEAVDRGVAYAVFAAAGNTARNQVFRSFDEGLTWTPAATLPAQVMTIAALPSGTLLAAVNSPLAGQGQIVWRSLDQGASWQRASFQNPVDPILYDTWLPGTPYVFQTLTAHSFAADASYAYLGTYNQSAALTNNTNYVYRSADDGRTWQIASTTRNHRHIHSLHVGPDGRLYVVVGDDWARDGIFVSSDHGLTLQPLCTGRSDPLCLPVNLDFDAGGAVYGTDQPWGSNAIARLDLAGGTPTVLASVPYESFSASRLPGGGVLVGTAYEPAGGVKWNDRALHLYAVLGSSVYSVYDAPIPSLASWAFLDVVGTYRNGDAAVYRSGYGSLFVHLSGAAAAEPAPAAPAVSTASAAAANLAPVPGFETDPWSSYYTHGTASYTWAVDAARSGSRSLKLVSAQDGLTRWMTVTRAIAARPGTAYAASAWLRTAGAGPGAVTLAANFWDASSSYLGTTVSSAPLPPGDGWSLASVQAAAPPGTAYLRVEFRLNGPGTLWIDDVSVEPLSVLGGGN